LKFIVSMRLSYFNPWWKYSDWWQHDRDLRLWMESSPRWIPGWINKLSLEPFSLNFIYGPRQAGKTTGIKLLIKRLIEGGTDPSQITYVNVEVFTTLEQFSSWLEEYLLSYPTSRRILFLDEVTSLEGWWKPVKAFIDAGMMENVVLTVSGSSSLYLKKETDVFPGRRGKGTDVEVLPLDYPSFEVLRGPDFESYMRNGGFPRIVTGDESFFSDLIASIKREVLRYGYEPSIAMEVLISIAEKAPSTISYSSVASDIGTSHTVVRKYVKLLEDLYVIREIYSHDKNKYRKEKKIIFRDPGLATALEVYGVKVSDAARLEMIVQEHLARKYGTVYYLRRNGEIDVVAGNIKIEVKLRKEGKNVVNLKNVRQFLRKLIPPSVTPA